MKSLMLHFVSANAGTTRGGSETLLAEAAKRAVAAGHDVRLTVPDLPGARAAYQDCVAAGVDVAVVSPWGRWARIFGKDARREALLTTPADLIVVNHGGFDCGLDWAEECAALALPFATVTQAVRRELWPDDEKADRLRAALAAARQNYFVSRGNVALLETMLGEAVPHVAIAHNPPDTARREPLPYPRGPKLTLACVARLRPLDKGQDLILEVLARDKWRARPLHVTFFGAGTHERGLKRLAERMKLGDKVAFAGFATTVEQVWKDHHGLLLPSRSEGFSLSLLEALWCGRFAVTTAVGDHADLIEDGKTGWLMPEATAGDLDLALEAAYADRASWEARGVLAHARVKARAPLDPAADFAQAILSLAAVPTAGSATRKDPS